MNIFLVALFKSIMKFFPTGNKIIFESVPDYEGNSKSVFNGILKRNLNKKYKLIWLVNDTENYKHIDIPNVYFYKRPNSFMDKIKYVLFLGNVKFKITENACYPKIHPNTVALHLGHGAPIKNTRKWMYINGAADYALYLSETVKENTRNLYNLNEDQMICCGFPRNDDLILSSKVKSSKQYIIWLPTFRKNQQGDRVDSNYDFPFGIPIFQKKEQLVMMNELLMSENLILYIKPHYAAELKTVEDINLSHIKIIDNSFYRQQDKKFYEFVGESQALITDYSSIFFDYLLTNKPIAITLDDYEEYKNGVGLIIEDFKETVHAQKVYDFEGLTRFIQDIKRPNNLVAGVIQDKMYYHKYLDEHSTDRVLKFLHSKGL